MSVVAITGASAGIGEALAIGYARKGHHIFLGARRMERLKQLKESLIAQGAASVTFGALDVRSDESVAEWTDLAFETYKNVDILVNNAGLVLGLDPVEKGDIEDWATIFDTNVMGVLRLCRQFIPRFRAQNSGHIVMLGSIAGHQVYEGGSAYCASKFSVKAITGTLKLELNGTPIRVSSVDPGMVETEFSVVRFKGDKQRADSVYKGVTPLRAQDIADCVEFVTSRPPHVNIDEIIVMPTDQASVSKVSRRS
jgi:3-hydroxy acid dehydrogenase/malonic semialdehyde reductase